MWLVILTSLLQVQSFSPSGTDFFRHSESQANHYINHIEKGIHPDYNLWALTLLGSSNTDIQQYIEEKIQQGSYDNEALFLFKELRPNYYLQLKEIVFKTGSSKLLIPLLLKTEGTALKQTLFNQFTSKFGSPRISNVDYQTLCQSIINNKKITAEILPNDHFLLPHFFLLFDDNRDRFLSNQYINEVGQQWTVSSSTTGSLQDIISKISLFRAYYLSDDYSHTETVYHTLINNDLFPNSLLKLKIYRYLDYSMYRLGYYDRNLTIARQFTLPLAKYLNKKSLVLDIQFSIGINLYSIGKMREAKEMYEQILAKDNQNANKINLSSLYNNLGITYIKLGKYNEFLELQFQALKKAEEKNNYSHELKIFNNLFIFNRKSNDLQSALHYLEKSRKLAKKYGNSTDLGKSYIFLGSFYKEFKNDIQSARNYFAQAEEILDPENDSRFFIDLLNEQAEIYEQQKQFMQALEKYNRVLELTPQKNNPNRIDALINKAMAYLEMDKVKDAAKLIQNIKDYDLGMLDFAQVVKAKMVEADYLNTTGQPNKALDLLNPTLAQVVERARNSADLESGFWHVEDEYLDAFELTVAILNDNNNPQEAVKWLDKLKTINDASLYQSPLVRSRQLNESELTLYKRLTEQLDEARKKLLIVPENKRFEVQQNINLLKLEKNRLDSKLTSKISRNPVSIREIQNGLSAHELIMHVTELNDKYYIASISKSNVSIDIIPFGADKQHLFSEAARQVATNKTNLDSLYAITKFLRIKEIPDRIKNISIIPDSYLYQLPLDVLPLIKPDNRYSYGQVRYLIEDYNTSYLTSLDDFKSGNNQTAQKKHKYEWDFVGYGVSNFDNYEQQSLVPLPFAQDEIVTIAQTLTNFSGSKKTFINDASTKSIFKQTAPKARILHLATHSEVSERDPLFSTIYMSNNNTSGQVDTSYQSQIFAYELFELNLNNELIMLNSCESGSGSYIQGTGIKGISRSLRYAGANSLVLNLWSVNDMLASEFASYFYNQLNEGKSKSEALRNTKRYFLRTKNASPHFWGPYMLIGNPDPVVFPSRNTNMVMAGAFILFFLLMTSLSYMKNQGLLFQT